MTLLASDLINPAFVGAKNPDDMLAVEFYWNVVKTMNGKPFLDDNGKEKKVAHVRISVPGNETFLLDVPVREEHKRRFASRWQYFQIQEMTPEADLPGWKIEEWPELSKEEVHDLKYLRFSVVEQIAGASDMQVQRMGMNGPVLRLKAREALKKRAEEANGAELRRRDAEIAELKERDRKRDEEMAEIRSALAKLASDREAAAPDEAPPAVEAPRRGRPPKVRDEVS